MDPLLSLYKTMLLSVKDRSHGHMTTHRELFKRYVKCAKQFPTDSRHGNPRLPRDAEQQISLIELTLLPLLAKDTNVKVKGRYISISDFSKLPGNGWHITPTPLDGNDEERYIHHLCQSLTARRNSTLELKLKYKRNDTEKGSGYLESFEKAIDLLDKIHKSLNMVIWKLKEPTLRPDGSIDTSAYESDSEKLLSKHPLKLVSRADQRRDGKYRGTSRRRSHVVVH
jgi:hypothetical protein